MSSWAGAKQILFKLQVETFSYPRP